MSKQRPRFVENASNVYRTKTFIEARNFARERSRRNERNVQSRHYVFADT